MPAIHGSGAAEDARRGHRTIMLCTMPGRLAPEGFVPSAEHRTETLWLHRQRPSDAEPDREAVMASRDAFRVWCDGAVPGRVRRVGERRSPSADRGGGVVEACTSGVASSRTWDWWSSPSSNR